MWKSMLAGSVALALSGAGVALAQQQPGTNPPAGQVSPAPQSAPAANQAAERQNETRAITEGRVAELRSRLSLTPDQEKNWPAFEQAYRDFAQMRAQRWRELATVRRGDNPVENFQAWADFASRRVNTMKRLADATAPLYQSLDQNQQRRFLDQIYVWHPRLARLNDRLAARGRDGDDDGWRGRGPGNPHYGHGMRGPDMGRGDDDDGPGRGYGRGPGSGMGPQYGWHGRRGDWDDQDDDGRGPGYGMGRGMGPCGGRHGHMHDMDGRGRYESGPQRGMCPRWGSRDGDQTDGSRGGWKQQDWRGGGSASPYEERL